MKSILITIFFVSSISSAGWKHSSWKEPINFQNHSSCQKQNILWQNITSTKYSSLPPFAKFGFKEISKMAIQEMSTKVNKNSDFAPEGWVKYLHRRGAVAKIKFIAKSNSAYTGTFKGVECGLLRLSLTFRPEDKNDLSKNRNVAPGLALKFLIDNNPSANVSALYTLQGQGFDYNFFANPLSNIVPQAKDDGIGPKLVHYIFKRATSHPEELLVNHFAKIDEKGNAVNNAKAPRHLFFVPNKNIELLKNISSQAHDVRTDFLKIPANTQLYSVYSLDLNYNKINYADYYRTDHISSLISLSQHIGDIVTTSEFIASEFGDNGLFFRHEARVKK